MTRSFYNKAVSRVRAPLISDPHNPDDAGERDWGNAVTTSIGGWGVSAGGTAEDLTRRDGVEIAYIIRGDYAADVESSDRIVLFGEEFEIDGGVLRQPSPTGITAHTILKLKRWAG